jgi:transposase InsO family protein
VALECSCDGVIGCVARIPESVADGSLDEHQGLRFAHLELGAEKVRNDPLERFAIVPAESIAAPARISANRDQRAVGRRERQHRATGLGGRQSRHLEGDGAHPRRPLRVRGAVHGGKVGIEQRLQALGQHGLIGLWSRWAQWRQTHAPSRRVVHYGQTTLQQRLRLLERRPNARVVGRQRAGWRAYWRWRSSHKERGGRPAIPVELQALIARMAAENRLWGQKRIQAELVRLGFQVSARTVAKYMRGCRSRGPTRSWREFLTRHVSNMWACDFFCVPTVLFQTLHVFFVIRLANRKIFHVAVTRHPTAAWAAQQIVECCAWDRAPPRFLIHDRDSRYGANFDRRVRGLGIRQVRAPFRSPRANAVAERWVRSVRSECLDHLIVLNEVNLRRVLSAYVTYYNRWRPHRSLGQAVPCGEARAHPRQACRKIVAEPVLGGLHHIYRAAA